MVEEKTVKEELKEIKDLLGKTEETKQKEKKPKIFKIPFKGKVGKGKVKRNWVTVMDLYENRNVEFTRQQIQDQTIMIDGIPRIATPDNVFIYKNKPLIINLRWSVKPLSPSDTQYLNIAANYKEIEQKGLNVKGYKVLMDRMKREALSTKKSLPWWIWLVGLAIIGVGGYILMQK